MNITIRELQKKDYKKAINFAIEGMNFDRYVKKKLALQIYGRYFLYLELERATNITAAYIGDNLVGLLIADMKDKPKLSTSPWRQTYIKTINWLMQKLTSEGSSTYDNANSYLLAQLEEANIPDGEICFLAADPHLQGKGIGSILLNELAVSEKDKSIYLFTDNNCTYEFYERKGFIRIAEKEISMTLNEIEIPLTCFLYSKIL